MKQTWINSKAKGTALAERNIIVDAPMTSNANTSAHTTSVRSSTALRVPSISTLRLSTTVATKLIGRRLLNLLFLLKLMVWSSPKCSMWTSHLDQLRKLLPKSVSNLMTKAYYSWSRKWMLEVKRFPRKWRKLKWWDIITWSLLFTKTRGLMCLSKKEPPMKTCPYLNLVNIKMMRTHWNSPSLARIKVKTPLWWPHLLRLYNVKLQPPSLKTSLWHKLTTKAIFPTITISFHKSLFFLPRNPQGLILRDSD